MHFKLAPRKVLDPYLSHAGLEDGIEGAVPQGSPPPCPLGSTRAAGILQRHVAVRVVADRRRQAGRWDDQRHSVRGV